MWCRSYRDHAIMAFPSYDVTSGCWLCQANITWVIGSSRESAFVRFPKRVPSEGEAVASALRAAQGWIDLRLKPPRSKARSKLIAKLQTRETLGAPRLVSSARLAGRRLSFEQFKFLMEKSGHKSTEQTLQKSYVALVQLRKQNHRSWAQIELRIRQPREPELYSAKSGRLPLTKRDWRRII